MKNPVTTRKGRPDGTRPETWFARVWSIPSRFRPATELGDGEGRTQEEAIVNATADFYARREGI